LHNALYKFSTYLRAVVIHGLAHAVITPNDHCRAEIVYWNMVVYQQTS